MLVNQTEIYSRLSTCEPFKMPKTCKLLCSFPWNETLRCYICHGGHSTPKVLVEHICVGIKNAAKGDVVFRDSKGGKLAFISPHVNQEMTNSEMPAFFSFCF